MSRALWKITAFVSSALNFIAFSCSTESLSAMTPQLPKPIHWENRLMEPAGASATNEGPDSG